MSMVETCLFALLRRALWQEPVQTGIFSTLDAAGWRALCKLAARQGVLGLAYEGLEGLPEAFRPPRETLLGWAVNVERIEARYARQSAAARALFRLCAENGLYPILLKGIALSRWYPVPQHRPCGDIDIHLGAHSSAFDALMRQQGIAVDASGNEKHSVLRFRSAMVENHRTFLDTRLYAIDRVLEEYLETQEPLAEEHSFDGITFRVLPPTADALFLLRHTARHLERGIGLRHICDWALFIRANEMRIDWELFGHYTERLRLGTFCRILSDIAAGELGADLPLPEAAPSERALRERVLRYLLDGQSETIPTRNRGAVLLFKLKRLLERRWVLREVLECSFAGHVWRSAVSHIRNPRSVFATRE